MHGVNLTYQALKILPAHFPLGGWDGQEVAHFLDIADCQTLEDQTAAKTTHLTEIVHREPTHLGFYDA